MYCTIDVLTDVTSSWIAYCDNNVIPTKVFKVYDNSKPWGSMVIETHGFDDWVSSKENGF